MKQKISDTNRRILLSERINFLFGDLGPKELVKLEKNYSVTVMDMFRVTQLLPQSIELTHLFNDEIYGPVFLDKDISFNLRLEDVFLMTLGLKESGWNITYMSPPYD